MRELKKARKTVIALELQNHQLQERLSSLPPHLTDPTAPTSTSGGGVRDEENDMEQSRRLSMQLTEAMLQWNKKPSLASNPIGGAQEGDDENDLTNEEKSFAIEDCDDVLNISRAVAATGTNILQLYAYYHAFLHTLNMHISHTPSFISCIHYDNIMTYLSEPSISALMDDLEAVANENDQLLASIKDRDNDRRPVTASQVR